MIFAGDRITWSAISLFAGCVHAVDLSMERERTLDWQTNEIGEVIAGGNHVAPGSLVAIESKTCLQGDSFNFNVRDRLAFDIDETVQLDVEFQLQATAAQVNLTYEKNGIGHATLDANVPAQADGNSQYTVSFTFPARTSPTRGSLAAISRCIPLTEGSKSRSARFLSSAAMTLVCPLHLAEFSSKCSMRTVSRRLLAWASMTRRGDSLCRARRPSQYDGSGAAEDVALFPVSGEARAVNVLMTERSTLVYHHTAP